MGQPGLLPTQPSFAGVWAELGDICMIGKKVETKVKLAVRP